MFYKSVPNLVKQDPQTSLYTHSLMTNSMNTSHNYVKLFFQMSLESTGNENPIFVKTKDT